MKIDFNNNSGNFEVKVEGRLDTTTAPDLDSFFGAHMDQITTLTLDCEALEYVSSAGLRVLLSAQKKLKGAMKLTGVQPLVMEVFEMTGFADILVIE